MNLFVIILQFHVIFQLHVMCAMIDYGWGGGGGGSSTPRSYILSKKDAITFIQSPKKTFKSYIIKECFEASYCRYEELAEDMVTHQKDYDDFLDVLCSTVKTRDDCQCKDHRGDVQSCKDLFKAECKEQECKCSKISKWKDWYSKKAQFDMKYIKKRVNNVAVETVINNNLNGWMKNTIKYEISREITETRSFSQTSGIKFEKHFTLSFNGFFGIVAQPERKSIPSTTSHSFNEKTENKVNRQIKLDCSALPGTFVICEAYLKQVTTAIPLKVTAVHTIHHCQCNIDGLYTESTGMEVTHNTTSYRSKPHRV